MKPTVMAALAALVLGLATPVLAQSTAPAKPAPNAPPGASQSATPAPRPSTGSTTPSTQSPGATQATRLVDINTASPDELDALPGIGKARSQSIISHRPYKSKDELVSKKIIPQNAYEAIKDKIVARQKG